MQRNKALPTLEHFLWSVAGSLFRIVTVTVQGQGVMVLSQIFI
jgi:hypothetical protein